jgi:hypothetical protein
MRRLAVLTRKLLSLALVAGALALPLAAAAVDPTEAVDAVVSAAGVRTEDGAIVAVLTNRGPNPVHDVRLLVDYVYHWPKEQKPGDVSPGKSWPHVFGGTIAPGASETVRFVPSGGLPTAAGGTFEPKVKVLGFKETKSLAP